MSNRFRIAEAICALAPLAALGACGDRGDDLPQIAKLRAELEAARVCAILLAPDWPIEQSSDLLSRPGVDALVSAGLVKRVPVQDRSSVTPRTRILVTDAGKRDFQLFRFSKDSPPMPQLCFGKKRITAISRNEGRVVSYRYHIIDAPAWTRRRDMRAAFPFLGRLLDQEQQAQVSYVEKQGRWQVVGGATTASISEIGNTGFFPCPYEFADPREDPCR